MTSTTHVMPAGEDLTQRERELGAIIAAYNEVTEQLKHSHEQLTGEVRRLREELARKNEQLRRRDRLAALGEMAAGVAHEIRNPLGGIQVFASLLAKDLADRPEALRLVGRIMQGVGRLESIVANILAFGRPAEPRPTRVLLTRVVQETIELAAAKVQERAVAIEADDSVAGVELWTDGALLQQALLNLVLNAVEATTGHPRRRDGARVVISAVVTEESVNVTVSDDGPGIPAELRDRIFNPFFTTRDGGTGLGLAIVHQIAEALEGSVQAANRAEGGAAFSMRLPRGVPVDRERTERGK